ncbi:hypothetical protein B0H11DRAFT_2186204 [Mycena galericulata]|nr:hypothetical protein B0H11DRAFT_2186204 [Mycena galericulata]
MFVPTVYGTRQSHRSKSCSAVYMVRDLRYRGLSTPLSVLEAVRAQHSVRPACGARRGAGQAILELHDAYDRAGSTAEASLRLRWSLPLRTEQLYARIIQFSDAARREYCRRPFHTAAGAISVRLAALCWLREWHAALSSDIVELGADLVAPAPLYKSWDFWQRFCARRCRRRPDGFDRRVPDADTEITSSSPALMVINTATERNRARRSKDAHRFDPSRWLEGNPCKGNALGPYGHLFGNHHLGLMVIVSRRSPCLPWMAIWAVNTATTSNTIVFSLPFGMISAAGTGTVLTTALGTINTPTNFNAAVPKSFTSLLARRSYATPALVAGIFAFVHGWVKASKMTLRGARNSLLREKDRPERGPRAGQHTKSTFAAYVARAWPVEVRMVSEISRSFTGYAHGEQASCAKIQ